MFLEARNYFSTTQYRKKQRSLLSHLYFYNPMVLSQWVIYPLFGKMRENLNFGLQKICYICKMTTQSIYVQCA